MFEPDGGQPFELKAGEITFNPAKPIHKARNASSSETAKVLNCMLAEKGQPLTGPCTIKSRHFLCSGGNAAASGSFDHLLAAGEE